ncbi:MAG: BrnT family toxin [Polynucleobacter sp.]
MEITYDQSKNLYNINNRNLSFEEVVHFDFETANYTIDKRKDYGEIRRRAIGYLGNRLYALIFTETRNGIRVISFRKANKREVIKYEQKN